ncbi:3-hydroxyacyl-CoA dehydrogenase NAD-binding domain-containing protein [Sphingosinicella microcystinivorans]|uniref:3-hydroxyacyl-CoA dehydrogenase NAD-binding domain-containing protein n=1 Tax=Sphingosinicella microcystinivorans TaxID=335406 RepID=UPI0022F3D1E2|nr:3-hydroxyacyl-CoA dehydrogenase NAD-binding domain-containing protein [Sphingosinicella microcystinivorans]WBX84395.1 3-hydroxyacyl-CoA dehydrogenase NAD-binding domain-containing protein [Sphingosinicella microcystinivorans]
MSKYFRFDVADGIATLTLDEADAPVNTVSPGWIDEIVEVIGRVKNDEAVRGLVITSAKPSFMAGADLKYILEHAAGLSRAEAFAFSQRATRMHRLLETCGKPVVAALNGYALGGGYELALACTHRILADAPGAVVGLPEVSVGLLPGSGGTQRLPRMIGAERAMEVLLEGRSYKPKAALDMGLVDAVVPPGELLDAARAWLKTGPDPVRPWDVKGFRTKESDGLLKQSTAGLFTLATGKLLARYGRNYPAPISILTCIFEGVQVPFDKGLAVESRHFARLLTDPVSRNIIRTTFVNKGLAEKGARRPQGVPRRKVGKIGVLGAGMMGAGIAHVAAKAGIEVVLLDMSLDAADKGKAYSAKIVGKAVEKGAMAQAAADALLARIHPTVDYADLAGAELVVEAVFEDTAIKADVTAKAAAAVLGEGVLFASNTSTLPITRLAEAFPRPERFIGLHFFSPVDRMALVEVIMGRKTNDETLAHALDFVAQIRKTPIVVNDSRGFYTSRVFQTFIHEGMELLREGVAPALIENGARQAGMPVGPLAVLDEVTLDLPMKIVRQSEAEDPDYRRPGSMAVMEKMAEQLGRSSRKAGGGFYVYPEQGAKHLWPGLAEHFPPAAEQPDVEEVKKRILYIQALETVRCLEENVLTHPADGDLGAVLGWGFPTWTGGTLSLIETVGVADFVADCDRLAQRYGARFAPTDGLRAMAAAGRGFDY